MEDKLIIKTIEDKIIQIEANYDSYRSKKEDVIMVSITNEEDEEISTGISVDQTKILISYLTEIVTYIESAPKIGDLAHITGGKFKGFTGKIYNIDSVASVREAIVEISPTLENETFYAFVNLCDLEVVKIPEVAGY